MFGIADKEGDGPGIDRAIAVALAEPLMALVKHLATPLQFQEVTVRRLEVLSAQTMQNRPVEEEGGDDHCKHHRGRVDATAHLGEPTYAGLVAFRHIGVIGDTAWTAVTGVIAGVANECRPLCHGLLPERPLLWRPGEQKSCLS